MPFGLSLMKWLTIIFGTAFPLCLAIGRVVILSKLSNRLFNLISRVHVYALYCVLTGFLGYNGQALISSMQDLISNYAQIMRIYARPKRPTSAPPKVTSRAEFPHPAGGLSEAHLKSCSWCRDFKSQSKTPRRKDISSNNWEFTSGKNRIPNFGGPVILSWIDTSRRCSAD